MSPYLNPSCSTLFLMSPGELLEAGVDEDVPLGRGHEIGREILAAHVVQPVGDPERRDRRRPVGIALGEAAGPRARASRAETEFPERVHNRLRKERAAG